MKIDGKNDEDAQRKIDLDVTHGDIIHLDVMHADNLDATDAENDDKVRQGREQDITEYVNACGAVHDHKHVNSVLLCGRHVCKQKVVNNEVGTTSDDEVPLTNSIQGFKGNAVHGSNEIGGRKEAHMHNVKGDDDEPVLVSESRSTGVNKKENLKGANFGHGHANMQRAKIMYGNKQTCHACCQTEWDPMNLQLHTKSEGREGAEYDAFKVKRQQVHMHKINIYQESEGSVELDVRTDRHRGVKLQDDKGIQIVNVDGEQQEEASVEGDVAKGAIKYSDSVIESAKICQSG